MFKSLAIAGARLRTVVLAVLILGSALSAGPVSAQEQCIEGACVSAGPRLVELDTAQSALLNPLLQALLPGTSINLSVADWNALANADINLNLLLTQLAADVGVSDPSQVLEADITLGQLLLAAANVLEADGQTLAASVLGILNPQLDGLAGTINLIDLLHIDLPTGSLAGIELDVLDLLTGMVQLYNFRNVVTTPQPITIDTGALGLPGIAAVELWAQVVEPPVYACGPEGTQFYSAAVRTKLNVQAVNTVSLDPIIDLLDGLNILGLVSLADVSLGAELLHLQLYADVARAEGAIATVDALGSAVTLQARPGLVNLYLGTIDDGIFWNRGSVITPAVVTPATLTSLGLSAEVRLLPIWPLPGVPVARITGDIGVTVLAAAEGSPELRTATVSGPFPATITMSSGTVSVGSLLTDLLASLDLEATGDGLTITLLGSIQLPLPDTSIVNAILNVVEPLLRNVLVPVLDPLLDLVLGDIVDTLLQLLGIQVGQATFTVEGIARSCLAELVLAKQLDPVDGLGLFDLAISQGGTVLASAAGVGHGGATAPVLTEAGATYDLAETAADGFDLSSYATTWACAAPDGTELDSGAGPEFNFIAPEAGPEPVTITCSFINRLRQASVSITKTDNSPTYIPGTEATYLITVANAGPDAATGIAISDTLPAGVTLSGAWSCNATGGSCGSASGGAPGETEVSVVLDLEPDGQAEISVPVQFSSDPSDY